MQPNELTAVQQRALDRLTHEWQSAYELQEAFPVLDSLVRKGLAVRTELAELLPEHRRANHYKLPD